MPKHSTEFQRLVALARKQSSDGSTVTESEFLQDSNGNQREVDICIKSHVDGLPITISIECYDQERPATIEWMYSQSFLVSSVRGSGSLPTTAASAASGCTGLLRAFLGDAAFFGLGIG